MKNFIFLMLTDVKTPPPAAVRPVMVGVCSSGGHLIQLESLVRMGVPLDYIISPSQVQVDVPHISIPDCNLSSPLRTFKCTISIVRELRKLRPQVIISTGAAPGGIALLVGCTLGCKTVWIDSIANAEKASLTGKLVKPFAKLWISQWKSVADREKGIYIGKIFSFFNSRNTTSV
ncbi:UDP-N-acetylglucosamine--LPS N-acetylglucosamine transferase [Stenotrophomonas sp. CFBP 13718]|nr:UDP-N-acetylglucosamine--LPS N-acetylglucosamine transferase [Stenotrophomonas sp. CFBP 13718]